MISLGVIIPNFNQGSLISHTIDSILIQSVPPDEIIVIDDGSTDDSVEKIREISKKVSTLRLIRNEVNRGVCYCMNLGTKEAKSEFVIYRAADDIFIKDAILHCKKAFEDFPDSSIAFGETIFFQDDPVCGTKETLALSQNTEFFPSEKLLEQWAPDFNLPSSACLVKRDAVLSVGGFKHEARWHADWLCLTTIALRDGLTFIPQPITGFRLSSTSYGNSNLLNREAQRTVLRYLIQEVMNYDILLKEKFMQSGALSIFGEPLDSLINEESESLPKNSNRLVPEKSQAANVFRKKPASGIPGVLVKRLLEMEVELSFLESINEAKVFVYGDGLQTQFLLQIWESFSLPPIAGIILTETKDKTEFLGHPVIPLSSVSKVDLVLLSSKSFESEMAKNLDTQLPSVRRLSFWIKQLTKI